LLYSNIEQRRRRQPSRRRKSEKGARARNISSGLSSASRRQHQWRARLAADKMAWRRSVSSAKGNNGVNSANGNERRKIGKSERTHQAAWLDRRIWRFSLGAAAPRSRTQRQNISSAQRHAAVQNSRIMALVNVNVRRRGASKSGVCGRRRKSSGISWRAPQQTKVKNQSGGIKSRRRIGVDNRAVKRGISEEE